MDLSSAVLLVFMIFSQSCWSFQESVVFQKDTQTLFHQLLDTHDARIRPAGPNGTDSAVEIKVNLAVRAVTSLSDYDMDFGVQVVIRQEWRDDRLKFEDKAKLKYLTLTDTSKVWTPDLFVLNEKDGHLHKLTTPNSFLRIYPTGQILYSIRLSLTLWCHMQLERFPFDNQLCSIVMASYGYTNEDLRLGWREKDAVQVSSKAIGTGFSVGTELHSEADRSTGTGEYSSLKVDLLFQRDLNYFILHTFLPSVVLVVVSWTSFWMDKRAMVARILLVLSTLFAMSSLAADVESSVPHVAYVKAMDVWAGTCFTFLLATLVELALVNALHDKKEPISEGKDKNSIKKPVVDKTSDPPPENNGSQTSRTLFQRLKSRLPTDPSRIDAVSRTLFPALFLTFVVLYFVIYSLFTSSTPNCSL